MNRASESCWIISKDLRYLSMELQKERRKRLGQKKDIWRNNDRKFARFDETSN
jgi:hypothetical protein